MTERGICVQWIATSTALYLSHALLADPDEPGSITGLLDDFVSDL